MRKSRRAIVLEIEMPDPRKAVAGNGCRCEPPCIAGDDRCDDAAQHQRGSHEVQPPARRMRMLGKIERVELGKGSVPAGHRQCAPAKKASTTAIARSTSARATSRC